jgi:3',5'-cyclic-AMP phosphodiesterase
VTRAPVACAIVGTITCATACIRPGEERAQAELAVGQAELADATIAVEGGLAQIRDFTDHRLELWSQSPVLSIELALSATAVGDWTIVIRNALPDATLTIDGGAPMTRAPGEHPTVGIFTASLAAGTHVLRVAPPDADLIEPFRVAAMADIQTALPVVDDVFEAINAVPDLRFVVAMGDITERSEIEEYELFDRQLLTLQIPYYTTLGNHELWAESHYRERFGRGSFQFNFKGVAFTFVDSGNAGIDPIVEDWLDAWLAAALDRTNIFLTHIPPIDPVGTRYGGFRSADDGRRLLARLVEGNVDLTLYGHIHTYIEYENAGIPAYISGGGGARPMTWDGIDRHFLVVPFSGATNAVGRVELHRVD